MKTLLLLAIGLFAFAAIAAATLKRKKAPGEVATRQKALLTQREQAMYWRLREAFPNEVVLAQVAFSALITSAREHRNRYDRKIADFVVCDASTKVRAVIELDDASHKGREANDAAREALLTSAGYVALRFPNVPDVAELRAKLQITPPTSVSPPPQRTRIAPPVAK